MELLLLNNVIIFIFELKRKLLVGVEGGAPEDAAMPPAAGPMRAVRHPARRADDSGQACWRLTAETLPLRPVSSS